MFKNLFQFFCSLSLAKIIRCHQEFGEIYSLALDKNYLLTGHTLTTTCVQVWNILGDDLLPCSTMRENSSESIIWNIYLGGFLKKYEKENYIGLININDFINKNFKRYFPPNFFLYLLIFQSGVDSRCCGTLKNHQIWKQIFFIICIIYVY